jgi:hypothetical protein
MLHSVLAQVKILVNVAGKEWREGKKRAREHKHAEETRRFSARQRKALHSNLQAKVV